MIEYKIKGLSCANCAKGLEEEIQKLEHGEQAKILFNSGKLLVSEKIDLNKVEKILASDGAYIEKPEHHDEEKEHRKGKLEREQQLLKLFLIVSAIIFVLIISFENNLATSIVLAGYLTAIVLSGYKTFIKGLKNLFQLTFTIDTLMTVALIGAIGIGEWKEGTLVAILFGLNEYLERLGMDKARKSVEELLEIAPKEATVIENGREKIVPIEAIKENDIVLVRAGEKIPSDGIVIEGKSSVNEAAITGESLPVDKIINDFVYGGSINNEGLLKIKITKAYEDSSIAKILHLVEEAQETKTPTEQLINRFAKYYTPFIMLFSLLVMVIPPLVFQASFSTWFYQGLAVLIVGCPCALILSSPIAIIAGITRNARNGILVKGGVFLEQLGNIDTIAFDKTGTLTKGEPYAEECIIYDHEKFLWAAGSLEKSSTHPIASAIMKKVDEASIQLAEPEYLETIAGQGIVGKISGVLYRSGNEQSINHLSIPTHIKNDIKRLKEEGYTLVIVSEEDKILGLFGITDEIRPESHSVIQTLHKIGISNTVMLTGDHQKSAEKVANKLGIKNYFSNLLPEEKVAKIKELMKKGKVAMVGDGINDAPALITADLGIAMGKGTDSAIETADIVLMQDHLRKLPDAILLSKRVNKIIKLNISLALGLKLIALILALLGKLTLWFAILSDMGATILVTLISLTVLIQRKNNHHNVAV